MATAHVTDTNMSPWGPGVKQYACDDGKYFAVMVDDANGGYVNVLNEALQELPDFAAADNTSMFIIPRDTTVVRCSVEGHPVDTDGDGVPDLQPAFVFPPRTTADEAMTQAGYTVV
jgi:hypothetical protein